MKRKRESLQIQSYLNAIKNTRDRKKEATKGKEKKGKRRRKEGMRREGKEGKGKGQSHRKKIKQSLLGFQLITILILEMLFPIQNIMWLPHMDIENVIIWGTDTNKGTH